MVYVRAKARTYLSPSSEKSFSAPVKPESGFGQGGRTKSCPDTKLLNPGALFERWFRRGTHRLKPATNVHLGMGFPAVMSSLRRIGGFRVPSVHGKLRLPTSNNEPVNRVTGHNSANLTSEFLYRCHASFPYRARWALARIIGNTLPAQRHQPRKMGPPKVLVDKSW